MQIDVLSLWALAAAAFDGLLISLAHEYKKSNGKRPQWMISVCDAIFILVLAVLFVEPVDFESVVPANLKLTKPYLTQGLYNLLSAIGCVFIGSAMMTGIISLFKRVMPQARSQDRVP